MESPLWVTMKCHGKNKVKYVVATTQCNYSGGKKSERGVAIVVHTKHCGNCKEDRG
jgi:hypothetical protein